MNQIDIKSLPLSAKASISWGFYWRGIVTMLGSAICGGLLGGIVGFILGLVGAPQNAAAVVGGILGLACSVFFLYLLICWLLSSRLGSHKLVLVPADDDI